MNRMESHIKRLLKESLVNDYPQWTAEHCSGADWSWTDFHSPKYKGRYSFKVSDLNFGTCVAVDGIIRERILIWPLSTLWFLQKRMKKHVLNCEKEKHKSLVKEALEYTPA